MDTFGVGTEMGVSYDAPALGGVYKLVEDVRGYRIKRSAGKVTLPGRKQIWRAVRDGRMLEDIIALRNEPAPAGARPLLDDVLRGGRRTWNESLQEARQRCRDRLASLPPVLKELNGDVYPVRLSDGLQVLRRQMAAEREDP